MRGDAVDKGRAFGVQGFAGGPHRRIAGAGAAAHVFDCQPWRIVTTPGDCAGNRIELRAVRRMPLRGGERRGCEACAECGNSCAGGN